MTDAELDALVICLHKECNACPECSRERDSAADAITALRQEIERLDELVNDLAQSR